MTDTTDKKYSTDTTNRKYSTARTNGIFRVKWKDHVPNDLDPEPPSSESSSKKNKCDKKKKCQKDKKDDLSDPSPSNDSDSSNDSDYRCKRHKKKSHRKKHPIKLCERLTEKLLTTAYKSRIIRFKIDEDPLQRRIYFLTFV